MTVELKPHPTDSLKTLLANTTLLWNQRPGLNAALTGCPSVLLDPEANGSPRLTRVPAAGAALDAVCEAWGEACGVALRSASSLEDLSMHLRAFHSLRHVDRSELPLRIAHGPTLAGYLATLNAHEAATLFGSTTTAQGARCPLCNALVASDTCPCGVAFSDGRVVDAFVLATDEPTTAQPTPEATRLVRKGRRGLQVRPEQLDALGATPPAASAPTASPAPLNEQQSFHVELKSGDVLRGVMLKRDPEVLRLRVGRGDHRVIQPDEIADMAPVFGPLRQWTPESWPVAHTPIALDALETIVLADGLSAIAILDGASMPESAIDALDSESKLIRGRLTPDQVDTATYLVALAKNDPQTVTVLAGVAAGWGSIVRTASPLERVSDHLRSLLSVTNEASGKPMQFRLTGPAILASYMPTANEDDAARIFGVVSGPCPVCDGELNDAACSWCSAIFTDGYLIDTWFVPNAQGITEYAPSKARGRLQQTTSGQLLIRPEQLAALGDDYATRHGFPTIADGIVDHVRDLFSDQWAFLGDDAALAAVHTGVAKARAYRLWEPRHITRFVDCMFFSTHGFDREPWAWRCRELLHDPDLDADARLDGVWELTSEWAEAMNTRRQPAKETE